MLLINRYLWFYTFIWIILCVLMVCRGSYPLQVEVLLRLEERFWRQRSGMDQTHAGQQENRKHSLHVCLSLIQMRFWSVVTREPQHLPPPPAVKAIDRWVMCFYPTGTKRPKISPTNQSKGPFIYLLIYLLCALCVCLFM